MDRICNDVEKLTSDCAEVKKELEDLRTENDSLNQRLENIESQSRRNNIILRGLPDERGESWKQCESAVRESLCSDFRMDREWVNNLSIERAHRLSERRGQPRDVIVKLSMFKDKERIKEAGKREKPVGLFANDDLTKSVRTIRGKLKDTMEAARQAGHRAYLSYDKLSVMNQQGMKNAYTFDLKVNNVKCLYKNFKEAD